MKRILIVATILIAMMILCSFGKMECEDGVVEETGHELSSGPLPEEPDIAEREPVMYYTDSDVEMLAKLMYAECRGIKSDTEKACVVWTVLNRVDHSGESIADVVTAKNQFAYFKSSPVWENLSKLAEDVLSRWNAEKNGEESVGRVLPKEYRWFSGDGRRNYFRNAFKGEYSVWDYSLETPYEN